MTRKKYVKQLMALGLTRNRANFRAGLCRDHGMAYAQDYAEAEPWIKPVMETAKDIRDYLRQAKSTGRVVIGHDPATGSDYGCEIKGHKALTPDGREILVIDEMHLLPPAFKDSDELARFTVGGGGHE